MIKSRTDLARSMLDWEQKRRELDALETEIHEAVLQLGATYDVGNVRATFSAGRRTFRYEQAAGEWGVEEATIEEYTTAISTITTDWRAICLRGLKIPLDSIPFDQSNPSVKLKLMEYD